MLILIREFQSPDEEMKKIVLKVGICFTFWQRFLNALCDMELKYFFVFVAIVILGCGGVGMLFLFFILARI
jgi:hypothetical protein